MALAQNAANVKQIFQLLLPVTQESDQLYLLVFMCILAPLFNWANSLLLKEKPVAENPAAVPRCDDETS